MRRWSSYTDVAWKTRSARLSVLRVYSCIVKHMFGCQRNAKCNENGFRDRKSFGDYIKKSCQHNGVNVSAQNPIFLITLIFRTTLHYDGNAELKISYTQNDLILSILFSANPELVSD